MEINELAECPVCFGRMQFEDQDGSGWLVCPNGCPTEIEAPVPKPPAVETHTDLELLQVRAAGSST